jgi:hypothetical protein
MKIKRIKPPATGPQNCLRSKTIRGECTQCGETPEILHVPLRLHGWFCVAHCPACNAIVSTTRAPERPPVATPSKPLPEGGGAVLARVDAKGGGFNRRPWGKRFEKYLES